MIEKQLNQQINRFQKKIMSFLDGTLAPEDRGEFLAFVQTHPEFEREVQKKREEFEQIQNLIPTVQLQPHELESLEREIQQSAFHLLKEEPKNVWDMVKGKIEDWSN